ncbi:MAG: flavodoxin [Clostridiales bacterium]|nr:flavodoxin [Clostridiales bacterium]
MSKIAVIYWSGTGNTAQMAQAIAKGIEKTGEKPEVYMVSEFSADIKNYDKIAFGCSAMGDEVLEEFEFEPFFEKIESSLSGKKIALFGSYGWGDGAWMRSWQNRVNNDNAILYQTGLIVNETPTEDDQTQCEDFGEGFARF